MLFSKPKPVVQESQYAPGRVGLAKNTTSGPVYEFFVVGTKRNEEDGPEKILQILQMHRAKLISVSAFPSTEAPSDFVISCIIDASKIDCQIDDLLIAYRKLRFVKRAERAKMGGRTFSNFLFPTMIANNRRAVVVDAESILMTECSLLLSKKLDQGVVTSAFFEEGRSQGLRVFKQYIVNPSVSPEKMEEYLTESIKGYFRASGWGIFSANFDRDVYTVTMNEPPLVEIGDATYVGGSYLSGLIAGILELKTGNPVKLAVTQQSYSKEKKVLTIYFAKASQAAAAIEKAKTRETVIDTEEAIKTERDVSKDNDYDEEAREEDRQNDDEENLDPLREDSEESEDSIVFPTSRTVPAIPGFSSTATIKTSSARNSSSSSSIDSSLGDHKTVTKILNMTRNGAMKVSLMHQTRLTMSQATEYLSNLMRADLLEARKAPGADAVIYYTTAKGVDYLEVQEKLEHMLDEDFMDTKAIRSALQ